MNCEEAAAMAFYKERAAFEGDWSVGQDVFLEESMFKAERSDLV